MVLTIKFLAGHLANRTYIYRNRNEFRPGFFNPDKQPLYLSDFSKLEILAQPSRRPATVKCTFINGEESLTEMNSWMLQTLQTYLYNKANAANGDEIVIPKRYEDIYFCIALICFPISLHILLSN